MICIYHCYIAWVSITQITLEMDHNCFLSNWCSFSLSAPAKQCIFTLNAGRVSLWGLWAIVALSYMYVIGIYQGSKPPIHCFKMILFCMFSDFRHSNPLNDMGHLLSSRIHLKISLSVTLQKSLSYFSWESFQLYNQHLIIMHDIWGWNCSSEGSIGLQRS